MKFTYRILLGLLILYSCSSPNKKPASIQEVEATPSDTIKEEVYNSKTALKLDSLFNRWYLLTKFNGNVLIAQHGKVIYKKCFGYADREKNKLLNFNSAFQLASVSKQFTAAAIMLLQERGLLNYTDTLQKYFPAFPYKNITIDMLLCHRSGLANYMYFCEGYCENHDTWLSNRQVIDLIQEYKPELYKKPGRRFQYSNTNYFILAAIIEKVSGIAYDQFLKTQIFEPLGMNDTWVRIRQEDTLRPNITQGYERAWKKAEVNYLDGVVGDKNVYSTVGDLLKWDKALYGESLLKQTTLQNAFTRKSKEQRGIKNYGYGWRLLNYPDGTKMVYHNGWWHGYNNSFYRRLNDQTTIIILSNRINKQVYQTHSIFEVLDGNCENIEEDVDA